MSRIDQYVPVRNPDRRSPSDPSLVSKSPDKSGPSSKEPAFITSKWGIGWQTPALMLSSYVLALVIAIAHLLLFRYLDGKHADGPHEVAPQSYISTASNILANMFGFFLRAALAVAFVQYLWYLLRISTMKVSTIELLFSIRSNPFILFKPAALRATPFLFSLSIVMWATQIVTSFPPGAITIITTQKTSSGVVVVPTFNASFMGNGSGADASTFSLGKLLTSSPGGFIAEGDYGDKHSSLMTRLAFQVLVAGESFALPSPCGANCSYTMEFEGPFFDCKHSTTNIIIDGATIQFFIYNGTWLDPHTAPQVIPPYNGTFTPSQFTSSVYTPLSANADAFLDDSNGRVTMQQDTLICIPGRASFFVNNTYLGSIHSRTVTTKPIDPLINLAPPTHDNEIEVPGFCLNGSNAYGIKPANWSTYALSYYRDNNIMTIIDTLALELEGSFVAQLVHPPSLLETTGVPTINNSLVYGNLTWNGFLDGAPSTDNSEVFNADVNGTIIDRTRFNSAFGKFSASDAANPAFNITQDLLNDYLFNITTSIMIAFGQWNTTSNATISTSFNAYSFSRPLSLILPYFISLALAVPFLLIGGLALHKNGVSAIDGGFIQIIATATGSAVLDRAAAGGCLGGEENIPQALEDLEIKFGEIINREEPGRIKRAGFGVESEITTLKKGDNYGIARWI